MWASCVSNHEHVCPDSSPAGHRCKASRVRAGTLAAQNEWTKLSSPNFQARAEVVQIMTILQHSSRHNWRGSRPNTAGTVMLVNSSFACLLHGNEVRPFSNLEILRRRGHPCSAACPPGESTQHPTSYQGLFGRVSIRCYRNFIN
jgi:hypothetical protein